MRKLLSALLALMVVAGLTVPALAAPAVDTGKTVTLTMEAKTEQGKALADEAFRLYYVADMSSLVEFTLAGDFADAAVSLEGMTADRWTAMATTLEGYVASKNIEPLATATSDASGLVKFTPSTGVGLYLLLGDRSGLTA